MSRSRQTCVCRWNGSAEDLRDRSPGGKAMPCMSSGPLGFREGGKAGTPKTTPKMSMEPRVQKMT
jgi:hypothetical protein